MPARAHGQTPSNGFDNAAPGQVIELVGLILHLNLSYDNAETSVQQESALPTLAVSCRENGKVRQDLTLEDTFVTLNCHGT